MLPLSPVSNEGFILPHLVSTSFSITYLIILSTCLSLRTTLFDKPSQVILIPVTMRILLHLAALVLIIVAAGLVHDDGAVTYSSVKL